MEQTWTTQIWMPACCSIACWADVSGVNGPKAICKCGHGPMSWCPRCKLCKRAENVIHGVCSDCVIRASA